MALMPIGGGGAAPRRPTCFRCGEPAAGPCALCRTLVCAGDDCSVVVEEPGLPEVVLCADCARLRPWFAARRWTAPALALASAVVGAVVGVTWSDAWPTGVGVILAGTLAILAGALALSRWQWRSRLGKAR